MSNSEKPEPVIETGGHVSTSVETTLDSMTVVVQTAGGSFRIVATTPADISSLVRVFKMTHANAEDAAISMGVDPYVVSGTTGERVTDTDKDTKAGVETDDAPKKTTADIIRNTIRKFTDDEVSRSLRTIIIEIVTIETGMGPSPSPAAKSGLFLLLDLYVEEANKRRIEMPFLPAPWAMPDLAGAGGAGSAPLPDDLIEAMKKAGVTIVTL